MRSTGSGPSSATVAAAGAPGDLRHDHLLRCYLFRARGRRRDGVAMTTPSQAIKAECRFCKGGQLFRCESTACALNHAGRPLPKIKSHCRECSGDDHPKNCTGRLLAGTTCNLYEFRLGKNPHAKKRILSPELKGKLAEAGREHRFRTVQNSPSEAVGSTISLPGVVEGGK